MEVEMEESMDQEKPTAGTEPAGAGKRFEQAKEFVGEKAHAATDAMKTKYTAAKAKVEEIDLSDVGEKVRTFVRSNPGKALLFSIAAGFLLGLLVRGRSDEEE